jgi:hypothetical protein
VEDGDGPGYGANGVVVFGAMEQGGQSARRGHPAHHEHVVHRDAALDHGADAQVHVGGHTSVELVLAPTPLGPQCRRGVVQEARSQRFQQLVGAITGKEHGRDVCLRDRCIGITRHR